MKTEEEVLKDTKEVAEKTFKSSDEIKDNKRLEHFSFFLPESLSILEYSANNVILQNDDQTYIVFYNKFEKPSSKLNYTSAKLSKALIINSFKEKNKFGYIRVLPGENGKYELQAGIGGVKITTYTEKSSMDEDAKDMMKIARSIVEPSVDTAINSK